METKENTELIAIPKEEEIPVKLAIKQREK